MRVKLTILVVFIAVIGQECVSGAPAIDFYDIINNNLCRNCPEDASSCTKESEAVGDNIKIVVSCFDRQNHIIKTQNFTEKNPFGVRTYFKGKSFSGFLPQHEIKIQMMGSYQPQFDFPNLIQPDCTGQNSEDSSEGIETVKESMDPVYLPKKETIGPKSEVEAV